MGFLVGPGPALVLLFGGVLWLGRFSALEVAYWLVGFSLLGTDVGVPIGGIRRRAGFLRLDRFAKLQPFRFSRLVVRSCRGDDVALPSLWS